MHSRSRGVEIVDGSGIPKPGIPGIVICGGVSSVATPCAIVPNNCAGGVGKVPAASEIGADGIKVPNPPGVGPT
ncbi:hypothetical protein MHEL_55660 [Mycolicibacterium helvum]|uniref:Uncharacterized protein n=1 Tax=Mycolicibacterium helvum TaxID=1534349 RepID=A0A7I7TF31_9MYCO|nr:hypothetical protein MHEL_55660 [Mycolicibacterium helvum]